MGLPIGAVSSDVEAMIVLADTIIAQKKVCLFTEINNLCKWMQSSPPSTPNLTGHLFDFFDPSNPQLTVKRFQEAWLQVYPPNYEGQWNRNNISILRCMPLVATPERDWVKECSLTSAHPVSIDAHEFIVRILRNLIAEDSNNITTSLVPLQSHLASTTECQKIIDHAILSQDIIQVNPKDHNDVLNTLYVAAFVYTNLLKITKTTDPFVTLFSTVIGKQMDSATTSNALIAGALLGSFVGYQKMKTYHITSKNLDVVANAALISNRPQEYKVNRLSELAQRLGLAMSGQL